MAARQLQSVIRRLHMLIGRESTNGLADAHLLDRFVAQRDEAAFEVLVWRHGTMVLNVCQRILRQEQDVEDAFQATFLVLAKKSGSISRRESVGSWLHKVAYRVALEARAGRARQTAQPNSLSNVSAPEETPDIIWRDLRPVLDEEVNRLPQKYRVPFILCYLQGKTNEEAAQELRCPKGTILSRLAWARARLRGRLTRRGLALASSGLGAELSQNIASAALSGELVRSSVETAGRFVAGAALAANATTGAITLADGALRSIFLGKLKSASVLVLAFVVTTGGAGLAVHQMWTPQQSAPSSKYPDQPTAERESAVNDQDGIPLPAGAVARLGRLRFRHGGSPNAVAYSPNGRLLASGSDRKVKIWESATGRMVRELEGFGSDGSRSIAFSPDSRSLAAGGNDRTVRLWDLETGRQVHLFRAHRFGHLGSMCHIQVAFTPDGGSLVSGGHDAIIQIWDVATGTELLSLRPEAQPGDPNKGEEHITALRVSPDGQTVAAATSHPRIHLWDLAGERSPQTIPATLFWVCDLEFAPDGKTLAWSGASSSKERPREEICVWDLEAGRLRLQLPGHQNRTSGIAFSPDGKHLACCGSDRTVKLWDVGTGKETRALAGHTGWTWACAYSPNGATLASVSSDGSIRLWDTATGQERLPPEPEGNLDQVLGLSVTPDGRTVLTGSKNRRICLWDLATGRLRRSFAVESDEVETVAFSPDGEAVAIGREATVELWEISSGRRLWSQDEFLPRELEFQFKNSQTTSLVFSRDGKHLVSTSSDAADTWRSRNVIRVWDTTTGRLLAQMNRPKRMTAPPVITPDAQNVALNEHVVKDERTFTDMAMSIFEMETGRPVREFQSPNLYANALALSPDGKMFVTAPGNYLTFWNTSGELQFTLGGTKAGVYYSLLAFSPDGSRIAAASNRDIETLQIWDIASGRLVHEFAVGVKALQFTPCGKKLVTGLEDGTVLVWDLTASTAARAPPTELTRHEIEERWLRQAYGLDSSRGNRGNAERTNAFAEGGDRTVAFLEEQLMDPDLPKRDQELARRLAAPLADPIRAVREQAIREIAPWGNDAWLAVKPAADAPASAELLQRIEGTLLHNLEFRRSSHGSIDVLKLIATPRARGLLAKLAQGPEDSRELKNRKRMARYTLDDLEKLQMRRPE